MWPLVAQILGFFGGTLCGVLDTEANSCFSFIFAKAGEWLVSCIRGPGQEVGTLPFENLAGRKQIAGYLKRMKEFLNDKESRVLGIYGKACIGKTTLLKIFNDGLVQSNDRRRFDHKFFITLSRVVDEEKIKKDIGEQIGGPFSSLMKRRFLLLLDDVWTEVDLASMGIPIPSNMNKCKVILACRSKLDCRVRDVSLVRSIQFLEVTSLSETESWNYFKRSVGKDLDLEDGEIVMLSKRIANRCCGLPLALKNIGEKMAEASSASDWREAERNLCGFPKTLDGLEEDGLNLLNRSIRGHGQVVGSLPDESLAGQQQIIDNLKRMKEFLDDKKARVLGIFGMGGMGKTTLLRKFQDKLVGSTIARRFDHVCFVTVSQVVDVEKIKSEIKEQIGGPLSSLIKSRFLLLMDDVWKEVDLTRMGIPIPSSENESKVIMAGRSRSHCRVKHVNVEDGTRSFEVSTLSESEAWIFFQRNLNRALDSEGGEIARLAKRMASRGEGLPLALEIVGKSMAEASSVYEWRDAERTMNRSSHEIQDFEESVLELLKFSFDRLKDDNVRNCLLYCCLFKEDEILPKDLLIDYWFGEGFLDRESLHEARDRGHVNIRTLISSNLLQEENAFSVRMHDVVRQMCLWLTSGKFSDYGVFYACHRGNQNYSSGTTATLKTIRRLYATNHWHRGETTLPKDFIPGPHLQTLLCDNLFIEEGFFQGCPSLRVLQLSSCFLKFALKDHSALQELRYLDLSSSEPRSLPNEIGSLPHLVHLDFSSNDGLTDLPNSIGMLVKLQQLNLSWTGLEELPKTIGFLTELEELQLSNTQLRKLPNEIGSLANLIHLDLSCNGDLMVIPDSIGNLVKLKILDLSQTGLKELPRTIKFLVLLDRIKISKT